jgi:phosphoribosyl 1,2-cyclic phosphodiesterase
MERSTKPRIVVMTSEPVFAITYWGVTGTLTAPLRPDEITEKIVVAVKQLLERGILNDLQLGPDLETNLRRRIEEELPFHVHGGYGGNTTCVAVQTPDALLILDCGSGFRELGVSLADRWRDKPPGDQRSAHVLITHPHLDHICGIPYFYPFYDSDNRFIVYGSHNVIHLLGVLFDPQSQLCRKFFPPTYEQMKALAGFRSLEPDSGIQIGSTLIRTHALTHPGGCLAYRFENAGRAFVFATDHEQIESPDPGLVAFARGADLLYTEGQYTRAEYEGCEKIGKSPAMPRQGWGHSTIEACVATAVAAEVRELHVGHRDPARNDENIARLDEYLRQRMREELLRRGRSEDSCRTRIVYEGMQTSC